MESLPWGPILKWCRPIVDPLPLRFRSPSEQPSAPVLVRRTIVGKTHPVRNFLGQATKCI